MIECVVNQLAECENGTNDTNPSKHRSSYILSLSENPWKSFERFIIAFRYYVSFIVHMIIIMLCAYL